MKHNCYMNYKVEVEFSNVTSKELGEILALDLSELEEKSGCFELVDPKIEQTHEYGYDGRDEPIRNSWEITYRVSSCGRIGKDSLKWYDKEFMKEKIDLAEEVAKHIMTKLNLTEEES